MSSLTVASLVLRTIVFILVIVAIILIMTAPGVCFFVKDGRRHSKYCPKDDGKNVALPMDIGQWNGAKYMQNGGQGLGSDGHYRHLNNLVCASVHLQLAQVQNWKLTKWARKFRLLCE
uniref:Transmembrane protein n=1 Tax=Steinernema glaseri TaxID=37863 RepID=A0A1I7XZA3_9BILA